MNDIMNTNRKRKITFVNASLTDGGSERVMSIIANYLAEIGLDVTMILVRNKIRTYEVNDKVNLIQLELKSSNIVINFIKRIYRLRKIIKKSDTDTIVSFMTDINFITILSCLGLNKKLLISERAHPLIGKDKNTKKPLFARIMIKILYPIADVVVFQTEFAKKCYPEKIQLKSVIIPNPISQNLLNPYNGQRNKVIVAAGRLSEQKNFNLLISAFYQVTKIHNDFKLKIYGQGALLKELIDLTKKLDIEEKVEFPGYVDDLARCIMDASIYVSSSDYEGISNSMLEAMAMGLPTVCTDCPVGGAAMVIDNNVNGVLVPVGDEIALTNAMLKIIEDDQFASLLSREAIKVRDHYSVSKICKLWLDVF